MSLCIDTIFFVISAQELWDHLLVGILDETRKYLRSHAEVGEGSRSFPDEELQDDDMDEGEEEGDTETEDEGEGAVESEGSGEVAAHEVVETEMEADISGWLSLI